MKLTINNKEVKKPLPTSLVLTTAPALVRTSALVETKDPIVDECPEEYEILTSIPKDLGLTSLFRFGQLTPSVLCTNPSLLNGLSPDALKLVRSLVFPQGKIFKFNVGVAIAVSTDSSGNWGGSASGVTHAVSLVNTVAEWSSLQALFDEVYVDEMILEWQPHNRYTQYNLQASAVSGAKYSVGLGLVSLHHGGSAYTSYSAALSNPSFSHGYTGDPFTHKWKNIDRVNEGTPSTSISGTAVIGQGWSHTNSTTFASYTGSVQSIGNVAMGGYTTTVELGRFAARWRLWFRNRA